MLGRSSQGAKVDLHLSSCQIGDGWCVTAIGHVNHVDARHHLEKLTGDMVRAANASRCHGELAWAGFSVGDKLGTCPGCKQRIDLHDKLIAFADVASKSV